MKSNLLYRRNPLAYPTGIASGFDPTHVAAKNMSPGHGLSAIAVSGGKMLSLLRGRPCTNASSTPFIINGNVGPSITSTGGTSNPITDPGNAAVVDTGQTLAAIVYYQTQATTAVFVGSGSLNTPAAWYLFVSAAGEVRTYTTADALSGITLTSNEAYFVAASNDGTNVYFIVKSLKTGKIQTATILGTGNATTFTSTGTYTIGSDTFNNQTIFPIAAVSYTPSFLSPSELLAWSADPWSFWYPRQSEMLSLTSPTTRYAAFSVLQRGGDVYTQMTGY